VTGLAAERTIALKLSPNAMAGGGQPKGAREAAESLIADGAKALLSFGLAGGLDPACRPGQLAIPRRVVSAGGTWTTDAALLAACGGPTIDALFAGQTIAASATQKAELHHLTGAAAIDLESGEVGAAAARHGLPFAVLRAICDPAERDLPPAALVALDTHGMIGLGRILLSLLRAPWQLPSLLALSRDAAAARAALVGFCEARH
jgi:adenosylhomocysteine nucleosidase